MTSGIQMSWLESSLSTCCLQKIVNPFKDHYSHRQNVDGNSAYLTELL